MSIFFSADLHFCHDSIRSYCNRPYSSAQEMNNGLIKNWNNTVKDGDTVYLLGDIGMGNRHDIVDCFFSLNGNIQWITGNHDKSQCKWPELKKRFDWIGIYKEIKIPDLTSYYKSNNYQKIVLFHYPIHSWNGMHHGSWMLHGHTHGTFYVRDNLILDVGVDCWDYAPVSYERVKKYMAIRKFVPVDGHGKQGAYIYKPSF